MSNSCCGGARAHLRKHIAAVVVVIKFLSVMFHHGGENLRKEWDVRQNCSDDHLSTCVEAWPGRGMMEAGSFFSPRLA